MSGYINGYVSWNQKNTTGVYAFDRTVIGKYKLDAYSELSSENVYFESGLIYVTDTCKNEVLPFHDVDNHLMITADAMIDNRDELISALALNDANKCYTDGHIILEGYKKWGYDTPKYLKGAFAFAIWDSKKKELYITRDHLGNRSLHYRVLEEGFVFSTTAAPLVNRNDNQSCLSEQWIVTFLSLPNAMVDLQNKETPFQDIYRCPIAEYMIVRQNETVSKKYWDPLNSPSPVRFKTEAEYIRAFQEIFGKAVESCIRTVGEVGLFLSGGLDSTSVAAFAAAPLKKQNKRLKTLTSVPSISMDYDKNPYYSLNEKPKVEALLEMYPELDASFLKADGENIIGSTKTLIDIFESPFKALPNVLWIAEGYRVAQQKGCKVVMKGQFGNLTISRGEYFIYAKDLIDQKRFIKLIVATLAESRVAKVPLKMVLKHFYIMFEPPKVRKLRKRGKPEKIKFQNLHMRDFVKPELLIKYKIEELLQKYSLLYSQQPPIGYHGENKNMLMESTLTILSDIDTKYGLNHGIVMRDPTKDIRVIEYCMNIPYGMYVNKGIKRYLIRTATKGYLPDSIRLNLDNVGVQGGDWILRLKKDEEWCKSKIIENLQSGNLDAYLDTQKLIEILESDIDFYHSKNSESIWLTSFASILSEFIDNYG